MKCPLSGHEIMSHYSIKPGPEIGKMQKLIMEALLEGKLSLTHNKQVYLNYLDDRLQKEEI